MDVILLENIGKLGDLGDRVTVKAGYGRNFLIPRGMAIIANAANRKKLDDFKADEAAEFWPAWKAYRAASKANGDRLLNLIRDFAMNYESMTDLKANELMTDYFSIRMQDLVIKQQFAKKIDVFLPAQKVMRVIQIENKLDLLVKVDVASEVPLVQ